MGSPDLIGKTIDGKYQMTRELGRGGMGTVYLAQHLGTERPVAVKIISPQFMQRAEFVERFRREARAAGRLRHPNVVDVTDFGFSESPDGQVAYLVMEYLDGCTLGEILDEEKNLPVGWTLDILEQVSSAVQEAHDQGIIHRDLKPDNIWLEPNQRGGYTVKVLDFGIAKLEEAGRDETRSISEEFRFADPTLVEGSRTTLSGAEGGTFAGDGSATLISDASTLVGADGTRVGDGGTISISPVELENKTAIYDPEVDISDQDTVGTRVQSFEPSVAAAQRLTTTAKSLLQSPTTAGLTRVGAVLGTPLYMSPEQCRGDKLDARSDIYSLGVIAYQMLSGHTPFEGDYKDVMQSHREAPIPPLVAKKVRRKMRRVIYTTLDKDPEKRPQSALAFANEMRSRSEGILILLRRAMTIYTEHLPKFLLLTTFFELPVILVTLLQVTLSFLRVSDLVSETTGTVLIGLSVAMMSVLSGFCAILIVGATVWIVAQYLTVPLRPVRVRPSLRATKRKWKKMALTGVIATIGPFLFAGIFFGVAFIVVGGGLKLISLAIGVDLWAPVWGGVAAFIAFVVGFFYVYTRCMLVAPVVMMENVSVRDSFRRSSTLVRRAFATSLAAALIMFLIPMIIAGSVSYVVNVSDKAFDPTPKPAVVEQQTTPNADAAPAEETAKDKEEGLSFSFGRRPPVRVVEHDMDMRTRLKHTLLESLIQLIWLPLQILILSFSAIIVGLLYIKTRLAGGESMDDLSACFDDESGPRKKWQERVRQRLIQSGRVSSRSISNELDKP